MSDRHIGVFLSVFEYDRVDILLFVPDLRWIYGDSRFSDIKKVRLELRTKTKQIV